MTRKHRNARLRELVAKALGMIASRISHDHSTGNQGSETPFNDTANGTPHRSPSYPPFAALFVLRFAAPPILLLLLIAGLMATGTRTGGWTSAAPYPQTSAGRSRLCTLQRDAVRPHAVGCRTHDDGPVGDGCVSDDVRGIFIGEPYGGLWWA